MGGFEDILGSFFGGGAGGGGPSPFGNSIFSSFFGVGMGGGRQRGPKRGEDLLYPLRYGFASPLSSERIVSRNLYS